MQRTLVLHLEIRTMPRFGPSPRRTLFILNVIVFDLKLHRNWPTLGIAVDWGSVQRTQEPAVWAIGVVRSPSILYRTSSGSLEERYPYFLTAYSDGASAVSIHCCSYSFLVPDTLYVSRQKPSLTTSRGWQRMDLHSTNGFSPLAHGFRLIMQICWP